MDPPSNYIYIIYHGNGRLSIGFNNPFTFFLDDLRSKCPLLDYIIQLLG